MIGYYTKTVSMVERISMSLFKDIKTKIDKHEIISFDVFDTLLLRPYVKPTDLFLHLEKLEKAEGFAKARIEAEQKARKIHSDVEDITLDEIYAEIADEYRNLKSKEMDLERQVLQPNPEMKEVFDYAKKQGKKIIIVSDMYLPAKFLTDILHKKGFDGFEKLYVSCEYRKTKHTGSLYKLAIDDLRVSANDIFHIGDNPDSDKQKAEKLKISAYLYPKMIDRIFNKQPFFKQYYNNNSTLGKSIIIGMMAFNQKHLNYWYNLGWNYGAAAAVAYTQWLDDKVREDKIKHLLFIARDGYILQKVFKKISHSNCKTEYLFAPRFVLPQNHELYEQYTKYLQTFNLPQNNLAMVDSITIKFSSQNLLKNFFPKILGYYWIINSTDDNKNNFTAKEFRTDEFEYMKEWGLMEFFFTAPHPPVSSFTNGEPQLATIVDDEQWRIEVYKNVEKGIIDYTETITKIFDAKKLFIEEKDIANLVDILPLHPTKEDKIHLSSLKHASDVHNQNYIPLMQFWNEKISEHTVKIFGLPLCKIEKTTYRYNLKLFNFIPITSMKNKNNNQCFYLLGIPVFQIKRKDEINKSKTTWLLFKFLPIISIKRK